MSTSFTTSCFLSCCLQPLFLPCSDQCLCDCLVELQLNRGVHHLRKERGFTGHFPHLNILHLTKRWWPGNHFPTAAFLVSLVSYPPRHCWTVIPWWCACHVPSTWSPMPWSLIVWDPSSLITRCLMIICRVVLNTKLNGKQFHHVISVPIKLCHAK